MGDQKHQPARHQQQHGGTYETRGPRITMDGNAFGNAHRRGGRCRF
ncbi:Uncharacterised protein [Mycobacteroides abscessus subsp. abscessus]|nr:Uncharacterised protein [Mycobacteroides abscessus subsp. abscessus]